MHVGYVRTCVGAWRGQVMVVLVVRLCASACKSRAVGPVKT